MAQIAENPENTENKRKSPLRSLAEFVEMLFITLFVMSLIFTYIFRVVNVKGDSMKNTLMPEERVIISMLGEVKQGDIAVIQADEACILDDSGNPVISDGLHMCIIKRIIAKGGQTVDIDFGSGVVYVDGERLREPYLKLGLTHLDEGAFTGHYPVTVPEGYVFVMGDNRSVSKDSRSAEIGFIPESSISGKVILRIAPLDAFGKVG